MKNNKLILISNINEIKMAESDSEINFRNMNDYKEVVLKWIAFDKHLTRTIPLLNYSEKKFGIIVYKFYYEWSMGLVDPDVYGNPSFPGYLDQRCKQLMMF